MLKRARALATLPHAGDWLNGVPSPALGLYMQDRTGNFVAVCATGSASLSTAPPTRALYVIPLLMNLVTTRLAVAEMVTGSQDHTTQRITRHNAVRDVLFSAAQSAALGPTREASNVVPDSMSRPADILTFSYLPGTAAGLLL